MKVPAFGLFSFIVVVESMFYSGSVAFAAPREFLVVEVSPTEAPSTTPAPSTQPSVSPSTQPSDITSTPSAVVTPTTEPIPTHSQPQQQPTPTPIQTATNKQITPTPTPSLAITPIAPKIYPQTIITVEPEPVAQVSVTPTITPTPTAVPILKRAVPIMDLLTYGNNSDYYGETGFTPEETQILLSFSFALFIGGLCLASPQFSQFMLQKIRRLRALGFVLSRSLNTQKAHV